MTIEEFNATFEIIFGEPQTISPGTQQVRFDQRQAKLKNRITGEITMLDIFVDKGSEELGELLVFENFIKS